MSLDSALEGSLGPREDQPGSHQTGHSPPLHPGPWSPPLRATIPLGHSGHAGDNRVVSRVKPGVRAFVSAGFKSQLRQTLGPGGRHRPLPTAAHGPSSCLPPQQRQEDQTFTFPEALAARAGYGGRGDTRVWGEHLPGWTDKSLRGEGGGHALFFLPGMREMLLAPQQPSLSP